jgi:4-amino-4-deoxychorismate lyase
VSVRVLRGGEVASGVDAGDRGLAYGDGVFETLLVHQGQPVWWREHWDRLRRGAGMLGLPLPDEDLVRNETDALIAAAPRAVLKLILTRGPGGRGYAPSPEALPTVVLSLHAAPPPAPAAGLNLRWCRMSLAIQPALAGIKHLNRLEQVLARAEWNDPDLHEGLMCDSEGRVISATAANLFARIGGRWLTPRLQRCGIAGIARAWLLEHMPDAAEAELRRADIEQAEALFLCNSVRGILPVRRLEAREWAVVEAIVQIRRQLAEAQPALAIAPP